MHSYPVRFFKRVRGANGHEVDACQFSFEIIAVSRSEAEDKAKTTFLDHF